MTGIVIEGTQNDLVGWFGLLGGETVVLTRTGNVIAPNITYFTSQGTGIAFDIAGSLWLNGLAMYSGNSMTIQSTGVVHTRGSSIELTLGDATGGSTLQNLGTLIGDAGGLVTDNGSYVYNAGRILAQTQGIELNHSFSNGVGDVLVNDGTITARLQSAVVVAQGHVQITNSGTIEAMGNMVSGSQAGILTRAVSIIQNSGVIRGTDFGIWTSNGGQDCTLVNSGTIAGGDYSYSVNNGFVAADRIVNTGVMHGNIYTGLGDDKVDSRGGTINGTIFLAEGSDVFLGQGATIWGLVSGGSGNDIYFTDDPELTILESENLADLDTVYASCSFRLADRVERLALEGTSDFRGWGNVLGNVIAGNSGDNRLLGLGGNDSLQGGLGNDRMLGGLSNDSILGEDGEDTLLGGSGADVISGGDGDDVINGGYGRDTMWGGAGADVFQFLMLTPAEATQATADAISDFTRNEDILNLSLIDANAGNGVPNDAFSFIGAGAFTGVAGQLHAVQASGGRTFVEGDVTGDGVADFVVRLSGLYVLTATDFVL